MPIENISQSPSRHKAGESSPGKLLLRLEIKRKSRANGTLILRENHNRAIAQKVRTISLCKQIIHFEHGLEAPSAVVAQMNRLTKMQIDIGCGGVLLSGCYLRHSFFRLLSVAGSPACAGAFYGARERKGVHLCPVRMCAANHLRQRCSS